MKPVPRDRSHDRSVLHANPRGGRVLGGTRGEKYVANTIAPAVIRVATVTVEAEIIVKRTLIVTQGETIPIRLC